MLALSTALCIPAFAVQKESINATPSLSEIPLPRSSFVGKVIVLSREITEVQPDGSYIVDTLMQSEPRMIMTARGTEYTTTVEHSQLHRVSNKPDATATLTATFVYNNQTVSCISKYESYTDDQVLTTKSLTASPDHSTTGKVTVQLKYSLNVFRPQNHYLTINCTPQGNVSKSKG